VCFVLVFDLVADLGFAVVWQSPGRAFAPSFASLQYDGNLVLYAQSPSDPGAVLWASNTDNKCRKGEISSFRLRSDSALVLHCGGTAMLEIVAGNPKYRRAKMRISTKLEILAKE